MAYVLWESGIWSLEKDISLARPQDFVQIAGAQLVYQGRLNECGDLRPRLLPLPKIPA